MISRHSHDPDACRDIREILGRVSDKWTILIVGELNSGPVRFNELKRRIEGISQRMLTLTLRNLEQNGLVLRTVRDTVPPQVEYRLTPLGETLREPIRALASWAEDHMDDVRTAQRANDGLAPPA